MGETRADLWSHPQLVAAVAAEDWAAVFRTYRQLTGLSQTKLGERVGLVQPEVSNIERGRRQVTSVEVRQRIVDGLRVPAHLLAADQPRVDSPPMQKILIGGSSRLSLPRIT
ncbi:helix-turn-helix transcriptional regulator, partial [Streptomyces sp. NPDC002812]|uniref:helix-turn-helix domain-containing protein n=1 Tax=Streptomyces sp. NPDC002812 TaxID=3154434 RepID=UPI003326916A